MSFILQATGTTGQTIYAVFYNHAAGWIWDNANERWMDTTASTGSGNGKLDYGTNWSDAAVALTEDVGDSSDPSGVYQLSTPAAIEVAVEVVDVVLRVQEGGSPAVDDTILSAGQHSVSPTGRDSIEITVV